MTSPLHDAQLRRCTLCEVSKPLEGFHRRGTGHQSWCKGCRKTYDAEYHGGRRQLRMIQKRDRIARLVDWMRELKSRPCTDCGGQFHPAAMAFDHPPGAPKRLEISNLVRRGSVGLARTEIAKCEIVCANCHAVRTFIRREQARACVNDPQARRAQQGLWDGESARLPAAWASQISLDRADRHPADRPKIAGA